jgi:hypothetical protein
MKKANFLYLSSEPRVFIPACSKEEEDGIIHMLAVERQTGIFMDNHIKKFSIKVIPTSNLINKILQHITATKVKFNMCEL